MNTRAVCSPGRGSGSCCRRWCKGLRTSCNRHYASDEDHFAHCHHRLLQWRGHSEHTRRRWGMGEARGLPSSDQPRSHARRIRTPCETSLIRCRAVRPSDHRQRGSSNQVRRWRGARRPLHVGDGVDRSIPVERKKLQTTKTSLSKSGAHHGSGANSSAR